MSEQDRNRSRAPHAKTAEEAYASLARLCARAEKSSGDALRLMRRWEVPEPDRERVLRRLISEKFIDDARYAGAYVREKMRVGGWGAYKIANVLSVKGISRDIIAASLEQYGADDRRDRLGEALLKKCRSVKAKDRYDLKNKLMRYGLGLGHGYEDVRDAVDRILSGLPED